MFPSCTQVWICEISSARVRRLEVVGKAGVFYIFYTYTNNRQRRHYVLKSSIQPSIRCPLTQYLYIVEISVKLATNILHFSRNS